MFSYRPPKDCCWGHALRPRDPVKHTEKLHVFFDTYFEPREEKELGDPRAITCNLWWKNSVLPNIEWAEAFLQPENENTMRLLFVVFLGYGGRVSFPMGILFPISAKESASYEFLGRFSADAPFKMSPKHFQVAVPIGKKGNHAWRKPGQEIVARLNDVIR